MKTQPWLLCAVVFGVLSPLLASGQATSTSSFAPSSSSTADQLGACNPITLQSVPKLTFRQRACFYGEQLIAPKFALAASFAAAFGQFANSPHVPRQQWQEVPHRFEVFYARRAARDAGELLAGYLHHEDPRRYQSNLHGFWHRTDWALMSVLVSPGDDGRLRPAYAPIAGSFTSAFVGSVTYRHNEAVEDTLAHAGAVYSFYFVRAVCAEFKPELTEYVHHILRIGTPH